MAAELPDYASSKSCSQGMRICGHTLTCNAHTPPLHVSAAAFKLISLPCADHADNVAQMLLLAASISLATTSERN